MQDSKRAAQWRRWSSAVLVAVFASSCATIKPEVTTKDTPLRSERAKAPLPEKATFQVATKVIGQSLRFRATRANTCRVDVTPVVNRVEFTKREQVGGLTPAVSLTTGLISAGIGVAGLFLAPSFSSSSGTSTTTYQTGSIVLIGLGAGMLLLAAIDAIRLRDSQEDLGEVRLPPQSHEEPCGEEVLDGPYVVRFADGTEVKTVSDGTGWLAPLGTVGAEAFGVGPECTATLWAGGADAGKSLDVQIGRCERIRELLRSAPDTRYAKEYLRDMQARCRRAFDPAAPAPTTSDQARSAVNALEASREACVTGVGEAGWFERLTLARQHVSRLELAQAQAECREAQVALEAALKQKNTDALDEALSSARSAEGSCGVAGVGERHAALVTQGEKRLAAARTAEDNRRVAAWKAHAGRCTTLQRDFEAVQRVWNCDLTCERIRSKILQGLEALRVKQPEVPLDEAAARRVQELCVQSECPSCPEETE